MSKHKKLLLSGISCILVFVAFSLPLVYVYSAGEKEIYEVASKIATDKSKLELVKEMISWENANIRIIYQRPHFSIGSFRLYVMPEPPYIYARLLDPPWVMFFKHGACREYAELFVKLAESAGIDNSRVIHNLGIDHAWAEVYDNGRWMHVDPSKINPITKERGIMDDPGFYERPENENGEGKRLLFVYAIDKDGRPRDVTNRYVDKTGKLIVYVDKESEPVENARVTVIAKTTQLSTEPFYTDENGICIFNLGENSYTIVAESGGYRAERDINLEMGGENHVVLSLTTGAIPSDILLGIITVLLFIVFGLIAVIMVFAFERVIWRKKNLPNPIKQNVISESSLLITARILAKFVAFICAFATVVGLWGFGAVNGLLYSKVVMLSWAICGIMGVMVSLAGSRTLAIRQFLGVMVVGGLFLILYGSLGFLLGLPVVFLSLISMILTAVSKQKFSLQLTISTLKSPKH